MFLLLFADFFLLLKINFFQKKNSATLSECQTVGIKSIAECSERVCNRKIIFLFLNQNICCGFSTDMLNIC